MWQAVTIRISPAWFGKCGRCLTSDTSASVDWVSLCQSPRWLDEQHLPAQKVLMTGVREWWDVAGWGIVMEPSWWSWSAWVSSVFPSCGPLCCPLLLPGILHSIFIGLCWLIHPPASSFALRDYLHLTAEGKLGHLAIECVVWEMSAVV